jgi:hypothetical protein
MANGQNRAGLDALLTINFLDPMENINPETSVKWSDEQILDLIRNLRNDLIKDFLDERNLVAYFAETYNRKELTAVKIGLMKKELKQLLIDPVDTKHYEGLIQHIQETGTASISTMYEGLFLRDMERIFKRYAF